MKTVIRGKSVAVLYLKRGLFCVFSVRKRKEKAFFLFEYV